MPVTIISLSREAPGLMVAYENVAARSGGFRFGHLHFGHLKLFRISIFVLRALLILAPWRPGAFGKKGDREKIPAAYPF